MAKTGRIQYLHDETTHAELILCEHSSISYPTHSHVSVLTAGMVLEGGIILTDGDSPRLCRPLVGISAARLDRMVNEGFTDASASSSVIAGGSSARSRWLLI